MATYAISNVFRGAGIRQWNEAILGVLIGSVAGFAMQLVLGKNLRTVIGALLIIAGIGTILSQT